MFDIGWQELFLIGIVALIVIGPKDLPQVLRAVMRFSRRMRGMAGEFQATMAEVVREADLDDIKRKVEAAGRDPARAFKAAVDPTGSLTADFDPDEFNRELMARIEAGPPTGPRASATPATAAGPEAPAPADHDGGVPPVTAEGSAAAVALPAPEKAESTGRGPERQG